MVKIEILVVEKDGKLRVALTPSNRPDSTASELMLAVEVSEALKAILSKRYYHNGEVFESDEAIKMIDEIKKDIE